MRQDSLFLSKEELRQFTGTVHRKLICAYLDARGIRYDLNRKLDVIVLRDAVKHFLSPGRGGSGGSGNRKEKELNL
jgi:hypothetical protein